MRALIYSRKDSIWMHCWCYISQLLLSKDNLNSLHAEEFLYTLTDRQSIWHVCDVSICLNFVPLTDFLMFFDLQEQQSSQENKDVVSTFLFFSSFWPAKYWFAHEDEINIKINTEISKTYKGMAKIIRGRSRGMDSVKTFELSLLAQILQLSTIWGTLNEDFHFL